MGMGRCGAEHIHVCARWPLRAWPSHHNRISHISHHAHQHQPSRIRPSRRAIDLRSSMRRVRSRAMRAMCAMCGVGVYGLRTVGLDTLVYRYLASTIRITEYSTSILLSFIVGGATRALLRVPRARPRVADRGRHRTKSGGHEREQLTHPDRITRVTHTNLAATSTLFGLSRLTLTRSHVATSVEAGRARLATHSSVFASATWHLQTAS